MESHGGRHQIKETKGAQVEPQQPASRPMPSYRGDPRSRPNPPGQYSEEGPIVSVPGGIYGSPYQPPVHHLRDHQGNLVLDTEGKPQLDHSRYV